jgi:hypothetical protein
MRKAQFEWDPAKDKANRQKHGVSFVNAQYAFADPRRVIARDVEHSETEERFYCFGEVDGGILTVRFTYRRGFIRIFGAGYWRKGKAIYEQENQIHE